MTFLRLFFITVFFIFPIGSFADDSWVIDFRTGSGSVSSGQNFSLIWQINKGGAPVIKAICPLGIKLYYASDNSVFPCDGSYRKITERASDSIELKAINFVGFSQPISFFLLPTDGAGKEDTSALKTASLYVGSEPEPIKSFTASSTIVESGESVLINWDATGLTGVNFKLSCNNYISASSSSYTNRLYLPCDQYIFENDLSAKSSLTLVFNNQTQFSGDIKLTVFPAFDVKSYNSAGAKTLNFTVKPFVIKPVYLKSSVLTKEIVENGGSVDLSWEFENSYGSNVRVFCQENGGFDFMFGTTTYKGVCGNFIFSNDLSGSGLISIYPKNSSNSMQLMKLVLMSKNKDGTYDGPSSKQFDIKVLPPLQKINQPVLGDVPVPIKQEVPSGNAGKMIVLSRSLYLGLKHSDVSILQGFLINENVYPEALVTGYFGPATERAVKKFQEKYALAKKGDSGYGFVGPKTRAKIAELAK